MRSIAATVAGKPRHAPVQRATGFTWKSGIVIAAGLLIILVVIGVSVRYSARGQGAAIPGAASTHTLAAKAPAPPPMESAAPASAGSGTVGGGPLVSGLSQNVSEPKPATSPAMNAPGTAKSSSPTITSAPEPPRAMEAGKATQHQPLVPEPGAAPVTETAKAVESPRGELAIVVKPWAMVSLNGKPIGQTPVHRTLPVGTYRIRIANDHIEKEETMSVTVSRGQTTTVERTWIRR